MSVDELTEQQKSRILNGYLELRETYHGMSEREKPMAKPTLDTLGRALVKAGINLESLHKNKRSEGE